MENLTTAAFVLGATQLIKDSGLVTGKWLQVTAIALGAIATYLAIYQPEVWTFVEQVALAVGVTGGVSFVDERIS